MSLSLMTLALAITLDLAFGEPPSRFHTVVWIGDYLKFVRGRWCSKAPSVIDQHRVDDTSPVNGGGTKTFVGGRSLEARTQFLEGGLGWVFGALGAVVIGLMLERILHALPAVLGVVLTAIVLKPLFAVRALFGAVGHVLGPLGSGDLEAARLALGTHLVSRPTTELREDEVCGATIESLFENLSDSVIAPILAFLIGGLPLALLYRYCNTADAMWGYHTPELEYRGKVAARADDALNLIPARVTGVLIVLASTLDTRRPCSTQIRNTVPDGVLENVTRAWRVMIRDSRLTASPNAGVPMSAAAGALGVKLEKRDHYALNLAARAPSVHDVTRAVQLARNALFIGAVITVGIVAVFMPEARHPQLARAFHGGPDGTEFRGLDFSVNTNPHGPNPKLLEAARNADHANYPDPGLTDVREALAAFHGLSPEQIVPAVGASELLHRLTRAYLTPREIVLSIGPAFGEFERAVKLERGFMHVADAGVPQETILKLLGVQRPRLVYVSRPNNPLGFSQSASDLLEIADHCARLDALLIVDEAYTPFQPDLEPVPAHPAIVRLESPGKIQGLVGLRLAYVLAPAEIARSLENLAPAWSLPAATAAALEALPHAQEFVHATLPTLLTDAARLAGEISRFMAVQFTGLHYFTLETPDAKSVRDALLTRGVKVRDCASFGLPTRIRIATRLPAENTVLVDALREITVLDGVGHG